MAKKNILSILTVGGFLVLGIIFWSGQIIGQEFYFVKQEEELKTTEIKILNVQSHPQKGDNWTVNFETKGVADLIINPGDLKTINDIDFVSLFCGEEKRMPQILQGDIIFYPDWSCDNASGSITHLVNVAGKHNLKFQFGNNIAYAFNSPDGWVEINAENLVSSCGGSDLEEALNGDGIWVHEDPEEHWFTLDLGQEYNITAVRGRSNMPKDPSNVDIYVSNDTENWGTSVASGISSWVDTTEWQEVDTVDKEGQYIKVVIVGTENRDPNGELEWGDKGGMQIFDVYEEEPASPPAESILVFNQKWATSGVIYASGTALTSNTSTSVELDLPKPVSRFATSCSDDIYWGIGIPSTTSLGVYSGTTTFEAKAD